MSDWTQPICEADWIEQNQEWDTSDRGDPSYSVKRPAMVQNSELEMCAFCGKPTIVGIYIRVDPKTVKYPS